MQCECALNYTNNIFLLSEYFGNTTLRKTHTYTRRGYLKRRTTATTTQPVARNKPENGKFPGTTVGGVDLHIQFERVKISVAEIHPRRAVVNYFAYCQEHIPEAAVRERAHELTQQSQGVIAQHYFGSKMEETRGLIDAVVYNRLAQRFAQAELFVAHVSACMNPDRVTLDGKSDYSETIASLFRLRGVKVYGAGFYRSGFFKYLETIVFCFIRSVYDLVLKPLVLRAYLSSRTKRTPRDVIANTKFIFWSFAASHYAAVAPIMEELSKRTSVAIFAPSIGRQLLPHGFSEHKMENVPFIPSDALLRFTQCLTLFAKRVATLHRLLTRGRFQHYQTTEDLFTNLVMYSQTNWKVCIPAAWSAETYRLITANIENVSDSRWIFGDDASPHARGIIGVLKASRAQSYVVQHGAIFEKYLYIPAADVALLWDKISKKLLLPFVNSPKRLVVLGAPKLESLAVRSKTRINGVKDSASPRKKEILLALASTESQNENTLATILSILTAARALDNVHIVFRPHPLQDLRPLFEILKARNVSLSMDPSAAIEEALAHADAVVVQSSTVALEAMLLRKPVIFWSPLEGDWLHALRPDQLLVVSTGEEFKSVLQKISKTKFMEKILITQDRFLQNIFAFPLKGSTKRTADFLMSES